MKIDVTAIAEETKAAALLLPWDLTLTIRGIDHPTRCPDLATVAAIDAAGSVKDLRTAVLRCIDDACDGRGGFQRPEIADDELSIVAGAIMAELAKKKQAAVQGVMRKYLSMPGK